MRITDDILYVGVNDHNIDLFEGHYIVPNGMAYNSYVINDEKRTLSLLSYVTITSGQCTIGANTNVSSCFPSVSVSLFFTSSLFSSASFRSRKKFPIIVNVFAFPTTFVFGYTSRNF